VADLGSLGSPTEREPVAIVINICPARPSDPLEVITTDTVGKVAGEGRKMRMNSAADLVHLTEVFSFVQEGLIGRANDAPPGRGRRVQGADVTGWA
jgi:hypothetical protein